jgi:uncharacterized membrane protein
MRVLVAADEGGGMIGDFEFAARVAEWIEIVAVMIIAGAVIAALIAALLQRTRVGWEGVVEAFRRHMARGLLIGLDLLIAADIITTVTLEATLENAAVLGIIVLVRTFLSWSLILETEGCWPWHRAERARSTESA